MTKLLMTFVTLLFTAMFIRCDDVYDDVTLESEYLDVLDNHGNPFQFDETGRPYGYGGISEENFNKNIAGKGWKCEGTWKINDDGTRCKTDFYKNVCGAGPTDYYFASDGTGKAFYISDAVSGKGMYLPFTWSFNYDKNSNQSSLIDCSTNGYIQVVGWSKGVLCVIQSLGVVSNGKTTYAVAIYKEMSDKELASYNENYSEAPVYPTTE